MNPFPPLPAIYIKVCFLTPSLTVLPNFFIFASLKVLSWYLTIVLIYIYIIMREVGHLFNLLKPFVFLLWEPSEALTILIWWLAFFLLIYRNYLFIKEISPSG